MPNRQFYTLKYTSSKLKACGYNITTTFDEAHELGEVVALADSQMLRLIRMLRKRTVDREKLERLFAERDALKKRCEHKRHCLWYAERLKEVKDKINRTMFVPDYITVVMEHPSHYDKLYENGFKVNEVTYKRLSCSAGQARVSTVVFCAEDIIQPLRDMIDNGRDKSRPISPSKYNAYFGTSTSATFVVTEPRWCLVPDYHEDLTFKANWDTETDWDKDDIIEEKEITMDMNRFDGQGLISPEMAEQWARDIGLDYVPSTFVVRQDFFKGLLAVFPFREFCEKKNNGNYFVDTLDTDMDGNPIKVDLREIDVIASESLMKLFGSWKDTRTYIEGCRRNHLHWGVAQFAQKQAKNILTMNY